MSNSRVIISHKHPVSARVRFLKQAYGGICGFAPLPEPAAVLEDPDAGTDKVYDHPAVIARQAETELGLATGSLDVAADYLQHVDVPQGRIKVYLVGLLGHDTPDEQLTGQGARLQLITEMRALSAAEMELLRRAYVAIMEG